VFDCEFELETAFNEVAERALVVGWSNDAMPRCSAWRGIAGAG